MARTRKTEGLRRATLSDDFAGPGIESPADAIVYDAWDADTPAKRIKLSRQALGVDLDAIDAYNLLGLHAETLAERIALLREATRIGERLFAPYIAASKDEEDAGWWGFLGTRPWMRAQHNLGLALLDAGDRDDAMLVFKRLLTLNPKDNQGIRMLVVQIAAEDGDYDTCKALFADYPDDWSLEILVTRLLVDIATDEKVDFAAHFAKINRNNEHVLPLLATAARSKRWPRPPSMVLIALGSKDAAATYIDAFRMAWQRQPKLLEHFLQAYEAAKPNKGKKERP